MVDTLSRSTMNLLLIRWPVGELFALTRQGWHWICPTHRQWWTYLAMSPRNWPQMSRAFKKLWTTTLRTCTMQLAVRLSQLLPWLLVSWSHMSSIIKPKGKINETASTIFYGKVKTIDLPSIWQCGYALVISGNLSDLSDLPSLPNHHFLVQRHRDENRKCTQRDRTSSG